MSGRVYLVGAGPGDPGLLTVRGREVLERADVVLHDRLGTEAVLGLARPDATLVDAGKAPGAVAMTQDEINAALIAHAEAGMRVVRLKGGDPFVFGRGGEEAEALSARGIAFEVVPGITSAIAAPAYAGIPVTHRGVATAFTVVTGHEDPSKPETQTDWRALARTGGSLVVLMGMGRLERIAAELIAGGRPPEEPVGVVQWGTTSRQRSAVGTLGDIADVVARENLGSPAVVVVGPVAQRSEGIAWRTGPLVGRRVVVTRARAQASDLSAELRRLGAEVVEVPTIRIHMRASDESATAIGDPADHDMIVLTSVNGVDAFHAALLAGGRDARSIPRDTSIIAIGPATAARLGERGIRADLIPERFVAEGILEALSGHDLAGATVLVARAAGSRPELVEGLRERGADVREVHLYEAIAEPIAEADLARARTASHITFTASSTVRHFAEQLPPGDLPSFMPRVISIGPVTSATAREMGLTVAREAAEHTIPGLVEALLADVA